MINIRQFRSAMLSIKEQIEKDNRASELMQEIFPESFILFSNNDKLINNYIDLIRELTGDNEALSDIGFFIYELDFGDKWTPECISDTDGTLIDLSTVEKLYYYLQRNRLDYCIFEAIITEGEWMDLFMERNDFYIETDLAVQIGDFIEISTLNGSKITRKVTEQTFLASENKIKILI